MSPLRPAVSPLPASPRWSWLLLVFPEAELVVKKIPLVLLVLKVLELGPTLGPILLAGAGALVYIGPLQKEIVVFRH
jgi:hypothetical protein